MAEPEAPQLLFPPSRRRFLMRLGVLAGVGATAPFFWRRHALRGQRLEVGRRALGTWVRIIILDDDAGRAQRAAAAAFAAIAVVDAQMSIHRADSQLSRVNAAAGKAAVPVDLAVLDVLGIACDGARRTDDIYDPAVLPLMRLYGYYDSGRNRFPTDKEIAATLELTGHRHILLDRDAGTLGLAREGVALDLGSIGKGWALDRAVDAIRAEGISSALVDVGGNIYALGSSGTESGGWAVGVAHPESGEILRTFRLRDQAVATSANTEQSRMLGETRVGHLFDARLGRPAQGHLSASVVAASGVHSDMLSTIAFLLGPDRFAGFPGASESHFIG